MYLFLFLFCIDERDASSSGMRGVLGGDITYVCIHLLRTCLSLSRLTIGKWFDYLHKIENDAIEAEKQIKKQNTMH
jgi:hypothetical protein